MFHRSSTPHILAQVALARRENVINTPADDLITKAYI